MNELPGSSAPDDGPSRRALTAAGFTDLRRAQRLFADPELAQLDRDALLGALAHAPDPDQALLLWIRLSERVPGLHAVLSDEDRAATLMRLLGASESLAEFLIRVPENADLVFDPARAVATAPALGEPDPTREGTAWSDGRDRLRSLLLEAVRAEPGRTGPPVAGLDGPDAAVALRRAYRRQLTAIALRDLSAQDPTAVQPSVSAWLADLAAAAIEAALAVTRAQLRERHGEAAAQVRLAVIGMGKCGARELNYISDVDVIFVHADPTPSQTPDSTDPDRLATAELDEAQVSGIAADLAAGISKVIGAAAPEPGLWEVDANLRPEGKDGALSRTLDSHAQYYRRWAHGWEFQALLKARPIAGDAALGQAYIDRIWPLVWESSQREGFVENVRRMRARVQENIAPAERERQIKLGAGGLRDVEFTAQLLQLVHGRADETVRVRGTLEAVARLQQAAYIGTRDAEALAQHYRWLRCLEHRVQLTHMRRTHLLPAKDEALRVLSRVMRGAADVRPTRGEDVQARFRQVRREVRQLHERIFFRPLLSTTAALSAGEAQLSADSVRARLAALGYRDPRGALRHIESLTTGVSRRAAMQRHLLPVMLGWLAEGADPDTGLVAFRRLSENLGSSSWFLRMLRDSDAAARRLCRVLSTSRFIGDQLEHTPEAAAWFGDDKQLSPIDAAALWRQLGARLARHSDDETAAQVIRHVRQVRRREVLRIAVADALGRLDQSQASLALADIDAVAVVGALQTCLRVLEAEEQLLTDVAVIAMGRQGGREITYGSDMDVMYVHRPRPGVDEDAAQRQAVRIAQQVAALLRRPASPPLPGERTLEMDADLRPEGRQGPLARTLESYREYYERWAEVWERQAMTRARVIAGDPDLAETTREWIDSVRYRGDLTDAQLREIRRIKARVESERLPRGADPARHVKLGRGGLSDVEWLVQTLQLRHAHRVEALRTTQTLPALCALAEHELLPAEDARALEAAWLLATRVRAVSFLWTGKTSDVLPAKATDLAVLALWCLGPDAAGTEFEQHYLRVSRHARQVFEKHFYGL